MSQTTKQTEAGMEALIAASAALALVERLLPILQQAVRKGQVTAEQQQQLLRRYESLKTRADGQFAGPEWRVR